MKNENIYCDILYLKDFTFFKVLVFSKLESVLTLMSNFFIYNSILLNKILKERR